ncbi:MAG: hypothetical protein Q9191_001475 [Dirinaria sp. TL-2023a]
MDSAPENIIILSDDEDDTGSILSANKKPQPHKPPIKKTAAIPKKTDMPSPSQAVRQGAGAASKPAAISHDYQKHTAQDTASAAATMTTTQGGIEEKTPAIAATQGQKRAKSFSGLSTSTEAVGVSSRSSSEPCARKVTKLRLTQPKPPKMPEKSTRVRTYLRAPTITEPCQASIEVQADVQEPKVTELPRKSPHAQTDGRAPRLVGTNLRADSFWHLSDDVTEPPQAPTEAAYSQAPKSNGVTENSTPASAVFRAPVAYMEPHKNAAAAATAEASCYIQTAKTPRLPETSPITPSVLNNSAKAPTAVQSTQRIFNRGPRSSPQPKQSNLGNVPGKRKPVGDLTSNAKRIKLTNPAPVTKTNSVLWSVPAYEPGKETTTTDEKKPPAVSRSQPFLPKPSPFSDSPSKDPSTGAASDCKDNATKNPSTATTPAKPAKKPRAAPWTCAQLSDLGNTIRLSVPWEEFAERSNKTVSECLQLYSVVVGMPLMDFQDKTLNRAKMAKFSERKKAYSDMEKEARKIHREEARLERKAEKERAKAEGKQKAKAAQEDRPDSGMGFPFGAGMGA